jgi:serine kinase of HPr protein (carbohydrate metabolism regulator)
MTLTVHATTIAIGTKGVLITGPSGAGKSDLALRLIDRGAVLVADDRTRLDVEHGRLIASPPATIAGMIEVRGIGIVEVSHVGKARVVLAIDLSANVPRMPEPAFRDFAEVSVPLLTLDPFGASAPLKVELALKVLAA